MLAFSGCRDDLDTAVPTSTAVMILVLVEALRDFLD